eukprot:SAG31_NODE_3614_length_4066_cov_16.818755_3_plen_118_part_00
MLACSFGARSALRWRVPPDLLPRRPLKVGTMSLRWSPPGSFASEAFKGRNDVAVVGPKLSLRPKTKEGRSPLSGCCRVFEEPSYLTRAATELREGWPALAARRYSAMSSELSGAAKD